jgi:signal transduction histidine kinase
MFVCEMSKSSPAPAPAVEVSKIKTIEKENDAIAAQKLFTNMVVHDLRNPAEAIRGGLEQA